MPGFQQVKLGLRISVQGVKGKVKLQITGGGWDHKVASLVGFHDHGDGVQLRIREHQVGNKLLDNWDWVKESVCLRVDATYQ